MIVNLKMKKWVEKNQPSDKAQIRWQAPPVCLDQRVSALTSCAVVAVSHLSSTQLLLSY